MPVLLDRLHNRFLGVVWALDWPDLGPTVLLFKPTLAFELSRCEHLHSELNFHCVCDLHMQSNQTARRVIN